MTTTNYINSNSLGLKVTQLPSGAFDLYFSNGFISTCYNNQYLSSLEWDTWRESSLPSELWLTLKEPLGSILKASMSLTLSLN